MAGFHFRSYEGAILTDGFNCDGFIMEHKSFYCYFQDQYFDNFIIGLLYICISHKIV